MITRTLQHKDNGFALLLTLVVVSVVLAIGLTLLDITLKQLILSGTGRDSEIAFHAAYAGAECAQYWRIQKTAEFDVGGSAPTLDSCLGVNNISGSYTDVVPSEVFLSQYQIPWGDGSDRCSEIDMYVFDASAGSAVTYDITYYGEDGESEECPAGATCTIVFARGYNRACIDIGTLRTVQREVVLEF